MGSIRLLGVPVRFHFTFLLLFALVIAVGVGAKQSVAMYVVYLAALFGSVILHELGHAVVGRRYGIRTLEIVMFPIGGIARLEKSPKPQQEFWIALAGPLVNVAIAAVTLGYLQIRGRAISLQGLLDPSDANLLERIAVGNLLLAGFNLIPAFPMDGGRILRAFIARTHSEEEATRIAAKTGRMLAMAMGLFGLLSAQYILVFIAFFVYLGAAQEGAAVVGRALTQGVPVRSAMITDFRTLPHGSTLRDAGNLLLATSQQDFPVVHADQVIGVLHRGSLLRGLAAQGPDAYVSAVMDREFPVVSPDLDLAEALPVVAQGRSCALVMEDGKLLGLLTTENLSEFLMLRQVGMQPAASARP
jgi:Zn-dependent protease